MFALALLSAPLAAAAPQPLPDVHVPSADCVAQCETFITAYSACNTGDDGACGDVCDTEWDTCLSCLVDPSQTLLSSSIQSLKERCADHPARALGKRSPQSTNDDKKSSDNDDKKTPSNNDGKKTPTNNGPAASDDDDNKGSNGAKPVADGMKPKTTTAAKPAQTPKATPKADDKDKDKDDKDKDKDKDDKDKDKDDKDKDKDDKDKDKDDKDKDKDEDEEATTTASAEASASTTPFLHPEDGFKLMEQNGEKSGARPTTLSIAVAGLALLGVLVGA